MAIKMLKLVLKYLKKISKYAQIMIPEVGYVTFQVNNYTEIIKKEESLKILLSNIVRPEKLKLIWKHIIHVCLNYDLREYGQVTMRIIIFALKKIEKPLGKSTKHLAKKVET